MTAMNKCPVCDGEAELHTTDYFGVRCAMGCCLEGPAEDTEEKAIAKWNRLSYKEPKIIKVTVVLVKMDTGAVYVQILSSEEDRRHLARIGFSILVEKEVELEVPDV